MGNTTRAHSCGWPSTTSRRCWLLPPLIAALPAQLKCKKGTVEKSTLCNVCFLTSRQANFLDGFQEHFRPTGQPAAVENFLADETYVFNQFILQFSICSTHLLKGKVWSSNMPVDSGKADWKFRKRKYNHKEKDWSMFYMPMDSGKAV